MEVTNLDPLNGVIFVNILGTQTWTFHIRLIRLNSLIRLFELCKTPSNKVIFNTVLHNGARPSWHLFENHSSINISISKCWLQLANILASRIMQTEK